jgi:hypothetical protein
MNTADLICLAGGRPTAGYNLPAAIVNAPHQPYTAAMSVLDFRVVGFEADKRTAAQKRLGQVKPTRAVTVKVSEATGDDILGDGTAAHPLQSPAAVNRLLRADATHGQSGEDHAAADSAPYRFASGTGWTVGGFIRPDLVSSSDGAILGFSDFNLWLAPCGAPGTNAPFCRTQPGDYPAGQVDWTAPLADGRVSFLWVSYTAGTKTLSIGVGDPATVTPVTKVLASHPATPTGTLHHNGGVYGGFYGEAGGIFISNQALTPADLAAIYANGHRAETLPYAVKAKLKSWWQLYRTPGDLTQTNFPDHFGVSDLVKATGNGNGTPLFPDPPVTTAGGGGPTGGADLTVALDAGNVWRDGTPLVCGRPGVTITRYGSGADPLLSNFTRTYAPAARTHDSGNTYYWTETAEIGWLCRVGEECDHTATALSLQLTPAQVRATPGSFCWDAGTNRVYVNVGQDPDIDSPAGWLGAPVGVYWSMSNCDNLYIRSVRGCGWGLRRPGTGGSDGLTVTLDTGEEAVLAGVTMVQTGYHAVVCGASNGGVLTVIGGRYGLCQNRREANSGDGTNAIAGSDSYAIAANGGVYECLLVDVELVSGAQPSCLQTVGTPGGWGFISHANGVAGVSEMVCLVGTRYTQGGGTVPQGTAQIGYVKVAATPDLCRTWVVSETTTVAGLSLLAIEPYVAVVNAVNTTTITLPAGGYCLSAPVGPCWLANSAGTWDAAGFPTADVFGNLPTDGTGLQLINCEIRVVNGTSVRLGTPGQAARLTADFNLRNTLFAFPGATSILGAVDVSQIDHCAGYGISLAGSTAPVTLASDPGFFPSPEVATALAGAAAAAGGVAYASDNTTRPVTPSIGSREGRRRRVSR